MKPSEVWKSAALALLRLNPKELDALALLFEEPATSNETRMLVLDLLAGAGTFEAQVVMRRILALSIARKNNRLFATYVQRLGFVDTPDGPTLRFLMSVYAESRGEPTDVRASCAYALGAAVGHAFTSGDPEAAVRASDVIRRDLLAAGRPEEKSALLTALGNAGLPQDVNMVARFVHDSDAGVRAAAAFALRKMGSADARGYLVELITDKDGKVARSALAALAEQKLDDGEIADIADVVLAGRASPLLDLRILSLLVAQRPRMTTSAGRSAVIESALRLLLGRVEATAANDALANGVSGERRVLTKEPRAGHGVIQRGDSVDAVRARMLALGLDPNARQSIIPRPPPRRATGQAPAAPVTDAFPRLHPYAVMRSS